MLICIENHRTCDFLGGGSGPPIPPLDPHMICPVYTLYHLKSVVVQW